MKTTMEYNRAFQDLIRCEIKQNTLTTLEEGKDASHYNFPRGFSGDYQEAIAKENIFRRYGTVFTHTKEGVIQTVTSTAEAKLTDEGTAYPEDGDSFQTLNFNAYKIATLSKLSHSFIKDMNFDLNSYLKMDFARRFGRCEEDLFINGTGVDEPAGILSSAELGVKSETSYFQHEDLIDLFFSVKPEYRQNAVWLMNDRTVLFIRKFKDMSGRYLLEEGSKTLLGKEIVISNHMPDIQAGALPVLFGDLSYFWILERTPLSIKVLTERYALLGQVGFAAHERLDGLLIRSEAVKTLEAS